MKLFKHFLYLCFLPCALCFASGAHADFSTAAKLLTAARAGDTRTVETLVRGGADVNYVDNTGMSIVCTAIKNKDNTAAQILQVYGADASKCDQQIKKYNQKYGTNRESGGFFSGLSTPQNMILMVGGAAAAVGGVVLLSSMSSSGDNNPGTGNSGGGHGGTDNPDTPTTTTAWAPGALPQGPSGANYDLNIYSTAANHPYSDDFAFMSASGRQNYLLLMRGYSPLARGYLGQTTFRNTTTHAPVVVSNDTGGGRPILTALITNNGINPTGSAVRGNIDYATSAAADATTYAVDKYYNNVADGGAENPIFDLSGYGSVFNSFASVIDSSLAKIIAGWEFGGRATGDFYGFAPNSQLALYRTGGGKLFTSDTSGTILGTANAASIASITSVNIGGTNYAATYDADTKTLTVSGVSGFTGIVGNDGKLYVVSGNNTNVYSFNGSNQFVINGQLTPADYLNYHAMLDAVQLGGVGARSVNVVANAALISPMREISAPTINDALVLTSVGANTAAKQQIFLGLLNSYYNQNTSDSINPGNDAGNLFGGMGGSWSPILISSTGEFNWGLGDGKSLSVSDATFENMAPALWSNLNHLFMSVVAVQTQNGTDDVTSVTGIEGATTPGKIILSSYIGTDGNTYASRVCGMAGQGTTSVDPWCFAAAGGTGEQAVASMAGAVAAINGAFAYMSPGQIFTLLALTSDGTLLAAGNTNGTPKTKDELVAYLQAKYELPPEYATRVTNGEDYLSVFAKVFGYGLVNLEYATKPNTNIYYATGTSTKGGIWRSATTSMLNTTKLSLSGSFGARSASVHIPVWDELTSADGSLSLPRVFENNFALNGSRRGIYLGDALGDFITEKSSGSQQVFDKFSFNMKFSESNRAMNMNGLDEMSFGYESGDWKFGAQYQHRLNDTTGVVLRGDGSNPILSLASDATASSAQWGSGAWNFGMRAFSGQITDEQLLESDPAISGRYDPARLGMMQGVENSIEYVREKFALATAVGAARESDTILGAYSGGLLGMGGGDTIYIDSVATFAATDALTLTARATFANTRANPTGDAILGLSEIQSNAFAIGAEYKNWSLAVTQPLAVRSGSMQYATFDYDVVENENGYELDARPYVDNLDLSPDARETRFSLAYRAQLGAATTGALGFVYRLNPDHTREFGNESILMLKVRHSIGI